MYRLKISESVEKELKKMDKPTMRVIKNWIVKNLADTEDPRRQGKALAGKLKGIWRYRVGDYRLFALIQDDECIFILFEVGHRRDIYRKQ